MNTLRRMRAFTLIELMIVIAIMSILATMAVPSFQDRVIRTQVGEGLNLAEFAQQAVAAYYARNHRMPSDNASVGLPPADRIVGNYVTALEVKGGALVITFGNNANRNLVGHRLALRPASVDGYPQVPLAWVCAGASVPAKMIAYGSDATDLPAPFLPLDCRAGGVAPKAP